MSSREPASARATRLATMLFCLAMVPIYAAAAARVSRGCFAYVDDGHLIGTVDECWRLWQELPQLLAPLQAGAK